ncbi:MAG: HAD family hydrolase [Pseudomonadota bacterium]
MTQAIEGILFDKDGTLLDYAATWRGVVDTVIEALAPEPAVGAEMAKAAGYDMTTGAFQPGSPIVSGATAEVAAIWAPFRPDLGAAGLEAALNASAEAGGDVRPVTMVPDLIGLLQDLGARGYLLGVATNDAETAARAQLARIGVDGAFRSVLGYDSVKRPKPAPDMILRFAEEAGIAPRALAMVGDSTHDLMAARAARCGLVVAVLSGPSGAAIRPSLAPLADVMLDSIADLPGFLATR